MSMASYFSNLLMMTPIRLGCGRVSDVDKLEVNLTGSGAIDNLVLSEENNNNDFFNFSNPLDSLTLSTENSF